MSCGKLTVRVARFANAVLARMFATGTGDSAESGEVAASAQTSTPTWPLVTDQSYSISCVSYADLMLSLMEIHDISLKCYFSHKKKPKP